MEKFKVGKITAAVGIKGEVRVYPYTDIPERFEAFDDVFVESDKMKISAVRYMKEMVILKLDGIPDRNAAELVRNKDLYIDTKDLWELEEDNYFIKDLIGLDVFDEDGNPVGKLTDVIEGAAQDQYEITIEGGKSFRLPAVHEFIKDVDIAAKRMVVHLIDGITEI